MMTNGCMSCGYPNGSLRDRTAADTALADKSKSDPSLGYVRYELLAEAWDSISKLGRKLFDERTRVSELEAENTKLRACVEAADDFVETVLIIETSQAMHRVYSVALAHGAPYNGMDWSKQLSTYRAARAEVDK